MEHMLCTMSILTLDGFSYPMALFAPPASASRSRAAIAWYGCLRPPCWGFMAQGCSLFYSFWELILMILLIFLIDAGIDQADLETIRDLGEKQVAQMIRMIVLCAEIRYRVYDILTEERRQQLESLHRQGGDFGDRQDRKGF